MNCERHLDEVDSIPEDLSSGVRPALTLVARAAVVGMLTGLLRTGFLTALKVGDRLRAAWAAALELWRPVPGWLAAAGLVAAVASAATPASVAVFLQRAVFHMPQDYAVPTVPEAPAAAVCLFFLFGAMLGIVGVSYNRLLLGLFAT